MGRSRTQKEKLVSSVELKRWARARIVPVFQQSLKGLAPSLGFAQIDRNGSSATFFVAIYTQSPDIYVAKRALLGVVRVARGRIELVGELSAILWREDKTIEGWTCDLVYACRSLGVDPALLASISNTFSTLYVF